MPLPVQSCTQMENEMLIKLPFEGFYNSIHDSLIDTAVEQLFQDDHGDTFIPESFIDEIDYPQVFEDYSKMYIECYQDMLLNGDQVSDGIDISLKFESLESPREYNFSTDCIYCEIPLHDVKKIYCAMASRWSEVQKVAIERHTSGPGFCSFYDPDVTTWGPLSTWDHNQLETLLIAFADFDQYAIVEDCHEDIDTIVYSSLSDKGVSMVGDFYDNAIKTCAIA